MGLRLIKLDMLDENSFIPKKKTEQRVGNPSVRLGENGLKTCSKKDLPRKI